LKSAQQCDARHHPELRRARAPASAAPVPGVQIRLSN
jgi:hypothetical protein